MSIPVFFLGAGFVGFFGGFETVGFWGWAGWVLVWVGILKVPNGSKELELAGVGEGGAGLFLVVFDDEEEGNVKFANGSKVLLLEVVVVEEVFAGGLEKFNKSRAGLCTL